MPVGDIGLWSLVGMAAMMGGTMRSPLTAMVFAVELTRDFNLFPALLVGSVAAFALTVLLMRRSVLTEKLARRGHHITREYSTDPFEFMRVREVMDKERPTIPATMKLLELSDRMEAQILGRIPVAARLPRLHRVKTGAHFRETPPLNKAAGISRSARALGREPCARPPRF
ncbi:MAG TPA: chloride channel protein [Candidatus Paceibacterota bacterium]|nr:chloride channel protein [Candidatus Paceibacterota bacterium]